MKFITLLISCLLTSEIILAESTYIKSGSIGNMEKEDTNKQVNYLPYRSIQDLVGEKILFLPQISGTSSKEYWSIYVGIFSDSVSERKHASYAQLAGKTALVTKIVEGHFPKIVFQLENGDLYSAFASKDSIEEIAPLNDLDYAQKKFIGTTLWIKKNSLSIFDAKNNKYGAITIKKYIPVKVMDIAAGMTNNAPIRFILQTNSGEIGFTDIDLSGTNVSPIYKDHDRFDKYFFTTDPRKTYKWSQKVWSSIESEKVFIGMSAEQAKMSWGEPETVNRTTTGRNRHEQWVYGSHTYLYFENNTLTTIQN